MEGFCIAEGALHKARSLRMVRLICAIEPSFDLFKGGRKKGDAQSQVLDAETKLKNLRKEEECIASGQAY